MNDSQRFDYFPDLCDQWTIWDNRLQGPVCFSGIVLIGLSEPEAKSICGLLNQSTDLERELERLLA